jgi:hypothetical protein
VADDDGGGDDDDDGGGGDDADGDGGGGRSEWRVSSTGRWEFRGWPGGGRALDCASAAVERAAVETAAMKLARRRFFMI